VEPSTRGIRDLIIPHDRYPFLNENQTLQEAIQTFLSFRDEQLNSPLYTILFVVNDQKQLVGKLSMLDILQGLAPSLSEITKVDKFEGKGVEYPNLSFLYEESTFATCGENQNKPIKPLLQPIDFSLSADTLILKALIMMSHRNNFYVPVTDNGGIIGVLRLEEIFNAMCTAYCTL
jgi:CBS domain-containing protein